VQTNTRTLLYDAGPQWHEAADAGGRIVAPFLRARGIRVVDAMIVSHRDVDHAGGALSVLERVPVHVLLSSLASDHAIVSRHETHGAHLRCRAGQHWEWDAVRFEVLFPEGQHYDDVLRKPNDLSCVLRVASAHGSALLAGDIEARSELELVSARRAALTADLLVAPHHGSRTSSTPTFIDAVRPAHVVFTVGYRNRFGHPRADVVARYASRDIAPYRTDISGALTFDFTAGGPMPPSAERSRAPRYWHSRPEP
jgi:competence protein ComEC